jgi:hypothetical protein
MRSCPAIIFSIIFFSVANGQQIGGSKLQHGNFRMIVYSSVHADNHVVNRGENQTWDFRNISSEKVSTLLYNAEVAGKGADFAPATISFQPEGSGDEVTFLCANENSIQYLGFTARADNDVVCHYDDPWTLYSLPMKYGDSFEDDFSSSERVEAGGTVFHNFNKSHYRYFVSGYGTLITEYFSLPGCLMLSEEITGRDSSVQTGKIDTTIITSYKSEKISWVTDYDGFIYEAACRYPDGDFFFGDAKKSGGTIEKSNSEIFSLYPDPAENYILLRGKMSPFLNGSVSIRTIDGKVVKEFNIKAGEMNSICLDISGLPAGSYQVSLITENDFYSQKFLKQ